jgi:hypothetical protein
MARIAFALPIIASLAACATGPAPEPPAVAAAAPRAVDSAVPCVPRPEIIAQALAARYGEAVTAGGVDANGNLVSVYSGPRGSWTITVTRPDGVTCLISAGDGWAQAAGGAAS